MKESSFDTSLTLLDHLQHQVGTGAWDTLVQLYSPLLRIWIVRYDVQPADADDMIQEVLVVVVRELSEFQHNYRAGAFRTWLRRILINRLRNFWRNRGRDGECGGSELARKLQEFEDPNSALSLMWDRDHNRHLVSKLLGFIENRFTESTREAFRRVAVDGATINEVAAELDMPRNAVIQAKSRVTRELRRLGQGMID